MSLTIHRKKSWPARAGDHMKDLNLKSAADAAKDAGKAVKLPAVTKAGKTVAKRAPSTGWLAAVAGGLGIAGAIIGTVLTARKRRESEPDA
jgi:hypothetical protein